MRLLLLLCLASVLLASCSGGSGTTCTSSGDCAAGSICVSGKCQANTPVPKTCAKDEQCQATEFCDVDHRCKTKNLSDASAGTDAEAVDLGSTPADATPGQDALEPTDTGLAPEDSGIAAADAGFPGSDAGFPGSDTGVLPTDAGFPPTDAGFPPTDAGFPPTDAGFPPTDAGVSCSSDPQCSPPATICQAPQCVPGCVQNPALCVAGEVCNPGTGRCQRCTLDADCLSADLICINTACTRRCDRPPAPACGVNTTCNPADGRCIPSNLGLGADCSIDQQCTSRLCLGLTVGTVSHSVCADPCDTSSYCPLNFGCVNLSGMTFCLSESLFTPPATFDVRAGGACQTGNIACQSGWCNTQAMSCIETCGSEQDCATFGGNCFTYAQVGTPNSYDHLCVTNPGFVAGIPCSTNDVCQSGICNRYSGSCASHCCSDADCGAGLSCLVYDLDTTSGDIVKVCAPKTAGSGSTPIGGSCTAPNDCESEVCVNTDINNPSSPRVCSTLCCTNADCGGITSGRCIPVGGPTVGTVSTIVGLCAPVP